MLLGEWWVANPTDGTGDYEAPDPSQRVPGALREVASGEFVLETIGYLGDRPAIAGGPEGEPVGPRPDIWGTDRDATCYSLFDSIRSHTQWRPANVSVSEGREDWSVGWLAMGNAWVTPDEECRSVRIRIDDLSSWALSGQPRNIECDDEGKSAIVDRQVKTLGARTIDGMSVSLVRGSHAAFGGDGQDSERQVTFSDDVYWRMDSPVQLQAVVEEWADHFESFVRFMTMRPSTVSKVDCHMNGGGKVPLRVELIAPRLTSGGEATSRGADESSPLECLATLSILSDAGIDVMDTLSSYLRDVAMGDSYMAMALHLESQDRLLSRGPDGALLNAIRSIESLYAVQNPTVNAENVSVRKKINDAVRRAGDVGTQLLNAWSRLGKIGKLRREVAHGKGRPSAGFGLQCHGGAIALQWIQRCRLLAELGVDETAAQSIVSNNFQYGRDLRDLEYWSNELGA